MMEKYTQQDMQNIFYEMDRKAYDFMQFQRDYYADKADDTMLMTRTTQPFWQSLRLSKRRLASKGLSMDVEISHDSKSKTIRDEGLQMRKDGYNLAGNKALNVKVQRRFYKNGKKISAIKNREICNLSLLKAEVNGDQAACPNCGYVSTISSFIDGCDACDSKFTVRRHIVGGANCTLISGLLPPRLHSHVGDRRLWAEQPHIVVALFERQDSCF